MRTAHFPFIACAVLCLAHSTARSTDYQKVADQQPWRFNWYAANLLYCVDRDLRDYEVEIRCPKKGHPREDHRLTIRLLTDGKEVFRFRGYSDTVFARSGDVLYVAEFAPSVTGCTVVATDLKSGKQLWRSNLKGIGPVDHSRYRNHVTIDAQGEVLVVRGHESLGRYIEYIDMKSGKTVGHKKYPAEEHASQVHLEGIQVLKILDAQTVFLRSDRTSLQHIHQDGGTGLPAYFDGITEYTMLKVRIGESCLIRGKNRFDKFLLVKIESGKAVFRHTGARNNVTIDETITAAPYEDAFWQTDARDNSRVTYMQFDMQGRKRVEKHYRAGKLDGTWTQWYDNGQKEFEYHYVNDERNGPSTDWYPTGQKRHEATYREGRMVGRETYWRADGTVSGTGDHPE